MRSDSCDFFVLTLPLVVKRWKSSQLMASLNVGQPLYNTTLQEGLNRRRLLIESKAWQAAQTLKNKKAGEEFRRLAKAAGFTAASMITFAQESKNAAHWQSRLGSNSTQRIAERVFVALKQYHFGNRRKPQFKGQGRFRSLEGINNTANIIWKPAGGCQGFTPSKS